MMGSHSSQISQEDRWKLVFYVQKLQGHDVKALYSQPVEVVADTTAAPTEDAAH